MPEQAGSIRQGVETLTREGTASLQRLFPLLNWVMELYRLGQQGAVEGICHAVIEHVVAGFSATSGSLAMREVKGERILLMAGTALPTELLGHEVEPGHGVLGEVLATGEPRLLEGDLSADPHIGPLTAGRVTPRPVSAICWPLQGEKGVVGALSLNRDGSRPPFTEQDLHWGQFLIDLIAIVLENLRLHIHNRDHIHQLESLNAEMAAMNQRLEQTQNQLLQSEKMAAIGQLAAGVAHEINNPVGYVHSNLGTLEQYLNDIYQVLDAYHALEQGVEGPRELLEPLKAVQQRVDLAYLREDLVNLVAESQEGVERVKQIVQDLKDFSHVGQTDWQLSDIHKGLDSTLNIVWNELKYKAEVVRDYGQLPQVECVPSQLNQVFMNLLVNAAQAIAKHGTITVSTRPRGEGWVMIAISDTGQGIAKDNLKRVFEPFYTTKPVGKGTGLGLSLSYGIITSHHGTIEVESEPGEGTTFTILLPVAQPDGTPEADPA